MGFIDKLWDETVAGPAPESGLGKLRKYDSLSIQPPSAPVDVPVTRSITILRSKSALPNLSGPDSPGGSSTPSTPGTPLSSGTPPGKELKRFSRKKFPPEAAKHRTESESQDDYARIMMSFLDR